MMILIFWSPVFFNCPSRFHSLLSAFAFLHTSTSTNNQCNVKEQHCILYLGTLHIMQLYIEPNNSVLTLFFSSSQLLLDLLGISSILISFKFPAFVLFSISHFLHVHLLLFSPNVRFCPLTRRCHSPLCYLNNLSYQYIIDIPFVFLPSLPHCILNHFSLVLMKGL